MANQINLHLALGGSFDAAPAAQPPMTVALTIEQLVTGGPVAHG